MRPKKTSRLTGGRTGYFEAGKPCISCCMKRTSTMARIRQTEPRLLSQTAADKFELNAFAFFPMNDTTKKDPADTELYSTRTRFRSGRNVSFSVCAGARCFCAFDCPHRPTAVGPNET